MEITGRGFIARNLGGLSDRYDDVLALAAGVSFVSPEDPETEFSRETDLVTRAARRCRAQGRKLVLFTTASAAVYGTPGCSGDEECSHPPTTPYGRHKLAMERIVRESGCRWLILRLSHLVGPDQPPHQLVPTLTRDVLAGRVRIFRGARRDMLDVRDFVTILDSLLGADVTGEVVNVASGTSTPVVDLVRHIAALLAEDPQHEYVDRSSDHQVRIDKLLSLVGHRGHTVDQYYKHVLDRYVPELSARWRTPVLPPVPTAQAGASTGG
ncbi:NAD-dependent epimerase/dehydratase family protein [Actinosynnema sp. NPDC051121]